MSKLLKLLLFKKIYFLSWYNRELTREEYNLIAKNRGIEEPQNMSTKELVNILSRYDSRQKVKNNHKKLSEIGLEKKC